VLLLKTLTSSTFKLALIAIATFGVIVTVIFSYVYLSTSAYVRSRSDRSIMTENLSLQGAYQQSGRDGLIALIDQRVADKNFAGSVYLLADPKLTPLAGNLKAWPSTATAALGWAEFRAAEPLPNATKPPLLRAMIETLPDGNRLLVGRRLYRSDQDRRDLEPLLDLRARRGRGHPGDAPKRGPDRTDQCDQPGHHAERPRPAHPAARHK
jgi:hypothetical protein